MLVENNVVMEKNRKNEDTDFESLRKKLKRIQEQMEMLANQGEEQSGSESEANLGNENSDKSDAEGNEAAGDNQREEESESQGT